MIHGRDRSSPPPNTASAQARRGGLALFLDALRERPIRRSFGLLAEYAMFASAVFLALSLFVLRVPLRSVDAALGLRLREHMIEFIARLSPG